MIIYGGPIYTINDKQPNAEAVVISGDSILYVGDYKSAIDYKQEKTQLINLEGKTMTPGLIEGHGHFMRMGYNELNIDLLNTTSYQEMIDAVEATVKITPPGEWIVGRGWHQSKWTDMPKDTIGGFQTHHRLSAVSPNNPVYLGHASAHAGFANKRAMEIAGVFNNSQENGQEKIVEGGEIVKDALGNPTGIFNERAMTYITNHIPKTTPERDIKAFEMAINNCHKNGITGFHDAGIDRETIKLFEQMKKDGKLNLRLYAMITGWDKELMEEWFEKGPMIDKDNLLTIRSLKLNCDGALGSRGAWLIEPYSDRPNHYGHETLPMEFVKESALNGLKNGFQVCAHAIGDRANREILDRYESAFKELPQKSIDHRFRIEHAQHLHPEDLPRFAELKVIPAMQAIHMSSDRPWAIDRLGEKRIKEGAYMWQKLLKSGVPIINGTDVPVEPINPIANFYASISRKTLKGLPKNGYEPEQKMTRMQALRSYTLDAAYGAFEEKIKGSIEVGKLADFTIFDKNIMEIDENKILDTEVIMTIFNGEIVYSKKN